MNISGYTIDKQIGKGGMAMVYRATQESLGRPVALKVMNPLFSDDPEFSERFLDEGRLLAAVHHNNIITIHDIGISDGLHFISMEYVDGGNLGDKIGEGLSPSQATAYLETLADCLAVAHEQHIVHRDIKPANILFRKDGTLLLTDFGIAKQLTTAKGLTVTGAMVGSPHYLSPQQAQGKPVDGRADIYSLGVLYYEMLTGSRPFTGDSDVDIAIKHVTAELPKLPDDLEPYAGIVDCMMRKNPDERFPSCRSLLVALRELRETRRWSGEVAAIPLPPVPEQPAQPAEKQNPAVSADGTTNNPDSLSGGITVISEEAEGNTVVLGGEDVHDGDTVVQETSANARTQILSENDEGPGLVEVISVDADPGLASSKRKAVAVALGVTLMGAIAAGVILIDRSSIVPEIHASKAVERGPKDTETAERAAREQAEKDRRAREFLIESLLADAKAAIADYRLTTPQATSAYTYYQKVLELAPDHPAALAGIDDIADAYYRLAYDAERAWAYDKASRFTTAGLAIRPEHEGLRALAQTLQREKGKTTTKIKGSLTGVKAWFD